MSGPITRTGATPKFWENYDRIFSAKGEKKTTAKTTEKKAAKATKSTKKAKTKAKKKK